MERNALIVSFSFEQEPEAFDVLKKNGVSWTLLPYAERKEWVEADYAAYWKALPAEHTALLMGADFHVGETFLNAAKGLRAISLNCAGMDHIDMAALERHGVAIRNVPRQNFNAVADLVFGQIICLMRRIALANRGIRAGRWNEGVERGSAVSGKTLGIVGTGAIGQAVARRALGFDMPVIALSRSMNPALAKQLGIRYLPHDEFFAEADIVVLTCPLADNTRNIINARSLSLMKPEAFIVNPSRGGLIDDEALLRALDEKRIAGAALDAFDAEPLYESPYFSRDDVLLTPHIGGLADREIGQVAVKAALNMVQMLG